MNSQQHLIESEFLEELKACLKDNDACIYFRDGDLWFRVGDGKDLMFTRSFINEHEIVQLLRER